MELTRCAIGRSSSARPASSSRPAFLVDDLDADAQLSQRKGGEQTDRPGTDDQDLRAGIRSLEGVLALEG
jgi:hypothetical protein